MIKASRGGRAGLSPAAFIEGFAFIHSSVIVLGSTVPRICEAGREVLIKDGGCTSAYALEASRPAYRRMTEMNYLVDCTQKTMEEHTVCAAWMIWREVRHFINRIVHHDPKILRQAMLGDFEGRDDARHCNARKCQRAFKRHNYEYQWAY